MPPKKGGGNKKGKAPAKRRPAPQVSPPRSSSDEESWAAIRDLQAKVAILEAKKREKQAPGGGEVTPRRSARDTKGRRRAEMRAMTQELTRRLNAVDSEQEQDGDGWNVDKGTTSGGATGGRKRKRNEAADCAGVAEGTSAGYDPYDEPSTSSQGAFEASCATGAVPDPAFPGIGTGSQGSARGAAVRSMADWRAEAARAIGMALAPRTNKKYRAADVEFSDFRRANHLEQLWPAPVAHIQQFIVDLHWKGLTPGTIRGKLAALSFYAKANGFRDSAGDFRIRKMLEGWSREGGQSQDDRAPISPAILGHLCDLWRLLCKDRYEESLFRAAALMAFFGALRISELVALGKRDVSRRALQLDDVTVRDGQVRIRLRSSKTDQHGNGCMVILGRCSIVKICPVRAVGDFGVLRGDDKGYFFQHRDGTPLTKYQFWSLTDMALERLGVSNLRFGTHSFRIGAASTAAALGYDAGRIKRLGRWSSRSYRKYIRQLPNV
uniref:Uncharacterized protein isoform X1 n=1 Tax=Pogona vitticeps TaxID=103695 RepID=A0ABM5GIN9_9SAUR